MLSKAVGYALLALSERFKIGQKQAWDLCTTLCNGRGAALSEKKKTPNKQSLIMWEISPSGAFGAFLWDFWHLKKTTYGVFQKHDNLGNIPLARSDCWAWR